LRHGATSRNGGRFDSRRCHWIFFFFCHYPSSRTMTLGSTQSVTEMSNRNISWSGLCVRLTTLPSSCADFLEIREPQPPGTFWACTWPVQGLHYLCFNFRGNNFLLVFLVSNSFLSFVMWVSSEYVNLSYRRNVIISF
jgi:hypothetical protein